MDVKYVMFDFIPIENMFWWKQNCIIYNLLCYYIFFYAYS